MADRGGGGWGGYRPYVRVADKLARGERAMARLVKKRGRPAEPARTAGRQMVTTFWGQAWCDNLTRYSDLATRLPRGRSYAGNGSVLDLQITAGRIEAFVAGSELYRVQIDIARLSRARWQRLVAGCSGEITSIVELLAGRLPGAVLARLTDPSRGLFPAPREIDMACSCLDWATMCKHIAATLYCVGARLDSQPELFFTLRQVDQADLVASAGAGVARHARSAARTRTPKRPFRGDLATVFGIDLDLGDEPVPTRRGRRSKRG